MLIGNLKYVCGENMYIYAIDLLQTKCVCTVVMVRFQRGTIWGISDRVVQPGIVAQKNSAPRYLFPCSTESGCNVVRNHTVPQTTDVRMS